ncbi:gastrokine-1 [Varanus komodoensis]|uniref:gastrokine-1 n=1 Tax=Varanus komodoensis TaxID=61221 RepID=UPI001CF7CC22|nr:gastrokine-1 [Varanus komodoensis]
MTKILGVALLASVLATDNISENNQGNVGGHSHQSVNIDQNKKVVNVDNNNGWHSWNTVWDYRTGYVAMRILSKKRCVVTKMNPRVMPDITVLPQAIREKQKDLTKAPARKEVTYMISPKRIADLTPYGKNIDALCRGIPTYAAEEVHKPGFWYSSASCFNADILLLLSFNYCGESSGWY